MEARLRHLLKASDALAGEATARDEPGERGWTELLSAVELLKQAAAGGFARPEALSPEGFLLCAEAALRQQGVPLARECVERFLDGRPASNQYLVRAQYTLGLVEAAECSAAKGEALIAGTLGALETIRKGLALSLELGPTHHFLVYNGSVHVYNVARPLLALKGGANELAAIFEEVLKALAAAADPDAEWRLRLTMEHARCMDRAGRKKEAVPILQSVVPLAKSCSEALQEQLLRLQGHMVADDPAALKKLRDENEKIPRRKALLTAQVLADGQPTNAEAEVKAAIAALDPSLLDALQTQGGNEAASKAVASLKGSCEDDDLLLALASQAAKHGLLSIASQCAERCASSSRLSSRVRAAYLRELMRVKQLDDDSEGPAQGNVYTRRMVGTRIEALKKLEEALSSARRALDPELIQDGCLLIWNVALPLLQPSLVQHAEPSLRKALAALEELRSPLAELRAAIHLELARYEYSMDFIQKAYDQVRKALALDLPPTPTGESRVERELRQMEDRLALQLDMYREATTVEERCTLLLERAKSAKAAHLKQRLLLQVQTMLTESEPTSEACEEGEGVDAPEGVAGAPEGGADVSEDPAAKKLLRERTRLWAELLKHSWQQRLAECSRAAVAAVLSHTWDPSVDGDLVRLQADAHYAAAEICVAEMQQLEAEIAAQQAAAEAPRLTSKASSASLAVSSEEKYLRVDELRQQSLSSMGEGIELGLALKDDLILHNGCIYVCNYNQALLRANNFEPLMPTLRKCVEALKATSQSDLRTDFQLLKLACAVASAFAQGLEASATTAPQADGDARKYDAKVPASAAALKEADEACKWAANLSSGRHRIKKAVTAVWARVQSYLGVKEPNVGTEPEAGALALLELLKSNLIESTPARAAALAKAKELLHKDGSPRPEPELWVRIAQQALALGDLASVVQACEAALRPKVDIKDGKQPLREEWKWYAMSECVHGEAISQLLRPGQQAELQEQLHIQALNHLSTAMLYANKAGEGSLLLGAAQRFWLHCKPFTIGARGNRLQLLRNPVNVASQQLEELDSSLQPKVLLLRVRLYEILLSLLADLHSWSEGVKVLQRAFSTLPTSAHEPLWEQKVRFMSKSGDRGLAGEMYRLKDFEPEVQARIWAVMGSSAGNKDEQRRALQRAVDVLASMPLKKVDYLITLAEWLFCNGFPLKDAEDKLKTAIQILKENEEETEGGLDDDEDRQSSITFRSEASTVKTKGSKALTVNSHAPSNLSRATSLPARVVLLTSQYEQLARIYLMRAMMAATADSRLQCVLGAHRYMGRIWALAISAANAAAAANASAEGSESPSPTPWTVPEELHDWASWSPDDSLRTLMAESNSAKMICSTSFPKATLSAFYVQYAIDMLLANGLTLHALMPLALQRVLAADVLKQPAMERAVLLQTCHVLVQLGMTEAADAKRALIGPLGLSAEQRRSHMLTLRELESLPGAAASPSVSLSSASPAPPRPRRRKMAHVPDEACWVQFSRLLLEEGQWGPAQEWAIEAEPLLRARGEHEHLARCQLLQARLLFLQDKPHEALQKQLKGMSYALEISEWGSEVVRLAEYQGASGDIREQRKTLTMALSVCNEAVSQPTNSAPDALAALAAVQRALAAVIRSDALALREIGLPSEDERSRAAQHFDAASSALMSVGNNSAAVQVLSDHAELLDIFPVDETCEDPLQEESSRLKAMGELFAAAHAAAERQLSIAMPRALPEGLSLPSARDLAVVKTKLAEHQLRLSSFKARERAARVEIIPAYPIMEGREDPGIADFLRTPYVEPITSEMSHEERALLYASSALELSGASETNRGRALLSMGLVLIASARAKGWGSSIWIEAPLVEPTEQTTNVVASKDPAPEEEIDPPPAEAGSDEAILGEEKLTEAATCALGARDWVTCGEASLALAGICGVRRAEECAKWLCLHHCCVAHKHWKSVWRDASECASVSRNRFMHLTAVVKFLSENWAAPKGLEAMRDALSALEDPQHGCSAWRLLSIPESPLAQLKPLLKPDMRVLQISYDSSAGTLYSLGIACHRVAAESLPKGAPVPEPQLTVRVHQTKCNTEKLRALLNMAESMRQAQAKGALARTKADMHESKEMRPSTPSIVHAGGSPTTIKCAASPEETVLTEEVALHNLAREMDAALGPLLESMRDLIGPELPAGVENLTVILVVDPSLSLLPFELMELLRKRHIGALTRDLSVAIVASRLQKEPPTASKKGGFGMVIDPRNEIALYTKNVTNEKQGAKNIPGATALKPLCAVIKEGPVTGGLMSGTSTVLLGSSKLPSESEWQQAMLSSSAFIYVGPGALFAQLGPEHVATLPLTGCAALLLLDRIESDSSSRRFAKEANQKNRTRLSMEDPHVTAALLSLSGVRTVLANQWSTTGSTSNEMLTGLLQSLNNGQTLAAALSATARSALVVASPETEPEEPVKAPSHERNKKSTRASIPAPTPEATAPGQKYSLMWSTLGNPVIYGLPSFKLI